MIRQEKLEQILDGARPLIDAGKTADYIPQLSRVDSRLLGLSVATKDGGLFTAGDGDQLFTIQSISKILIFTCGLMDSGWERVRQKVSVEPTADGFNSIVSLETKNDYKPLNPMINSGAIACLTLVQGQTAGEKYRRVCSLARQLTGNPTLDANEEVYQSEKHTGARNRALAWYMKSTGVIEEDVEELLDAYFRICSIQMDCTMLAKTALAYALDGQVGHQRFFEPQWARMVKAVMTLCGMYDESGRVAVEVGLPSKSGVGGGILSLVPGYAGIGIFGPALNKKGTSIAGLEALSLLVRQYQWSIF